MGWICFLLPAPPIGGGNSGLTAVAACLSPPPQGMFTSEKSFLHVLNLLFRAFKVLELSASGSEEPELNSSFYQVLAWS